MKQKGALTCVSNAVVPVGDAKQKRDVWLKTEADEEIKIDYDIATLIPFILKAITRRRKGLKESDPVLLPRAATKDVIDLAVQYLDFHKVPGRSDKERRQFNERFIRLNTSRLCQLTSAADALELRALVELASRQLARMIEGKSPEQIRQTFNLPDDLTEEEKLEPIRACLDDPRIRLLNRLYARKRKELEVRKAELTRAAAEVASAAAEAGAAAAGGGVGDGDDGTEGNAAMSNGLAATADAGAAADADAADAGIPQAPAAAATISSAKASSSTSCAPRMQPKQAQAAAAAAVPKDDNRSLEELLSFIEQGGGEGDDAVRAGKGDTRSNSGKVASGEGKGKSSKRKKKSSKAGSAAAAGGADGGSASGTEQHGEPKDAAEKEAKPKVKQLERQQRKQPQQHGPAGVDLPGTDSGPDDHQHWVEAKELQSLEEVPGKLGEPEAKELEPLEQVPGEVGEPAAAAAGGLVPRAWVGDDGAVLVCAGGQAGGLRQLRLEDAPLEELFPEDGFEDSDAEEAEAAEFERALQADWNERMQELMYGSVLGPSSFSTASRGSHIHNSSSSASKGRMPLAATSRRVSSNMVAEPLTGSAGSAAGGGVGCMPAGTSGGSAGGTPGGKGCGSSAGSSEDGSSKANGIGACTPAAAAAGVGSGPVSTGIEPKISTGSGSSSSRGPAGEAITGSGGGQVLGPVPAAGEDINEWQEDEVVVGKPHVASPTAAVEASFAAAATGQQQLQQLGRQAAAGSAEQLAASTSLQMAGDTGGVGRGSPQPQGMGGWEGMDSGLTSQVRLELPLHSSEAVGFPHVVGAADEQRQQQQQREVVACGTQGEDGLKQQQEQEQDDTVHAVSVLAGSNEHPMPKQQQQQLLEEEQQACAKDGCRPSDQDRSKKQHQQHQQQVWQVDVSACRPLLSSTPASADPGIVGPAAASGVAVAAPRLAAAAVTTLLPAAAGGASAVFPEHQRKRASEQDPSAQQLHSCEGSHQPHCESEEEEEEEDCMQPLGTGAAMAGDEGTDWQREALQQQQFQQFGPEADACGNFDEQQEEVAVLGGGQWSGDGGNRGHGTTSGGTDNTSATELGMQQQQEPVAEASEHPLGNIAEALALRERLGSIPHMVSSMPSAISGARARPCEQLGLGFGTSFGMLLVWEEGAADGGLGMQPIGMDRVAAGLQAHGTTGSRSSSGLGAGSEGGLGAELGLGLVGMALGLDVGESNSNSCSMEAGRGPWLGSDGSRCSSPAAGAPAGVGSSSDAAAAAAAFLTLPSLGSSSDTSAAAAAFPTLPSLGSGRLSWEGGDSARMGLGGAFAGVTSAQKWGEWNAASQQAQEGPGVATREASYGLWDERGASWRPQPVIRSRSMGGDGAVHVSRDGSKEVAKGRTTGPLAETLTAAISSAAAAGTGGHPAALDGSLWSDGVGVDVGKRLAAMSSSATGAVPCADAGLLASITSGSCEELQLRPEPGHTLLQQEGWQHNGQQQQQQLGMQHHNPQQQQRKDPFVEDVLLGIQQFLEASGLNQVVEVRLKGETHQQQLPQAQQVPAATVAAAAASSSRDLTAIWDDQTAAPLPTGSRVQVCDLVEGLRDTEVRRVVGGVEGGMLSLSYRHCRSGEHI